MSDVVIVGGGVIGAACALELAERGASVTLIERDHLAAHASGRNQGLWVLPEDEANLPMAQASLARYLEIAPDAPIDVGLDPEPVGMVLVANDRQEFQRREGRRGHGTRPRRDRRRTRDPDRDPRHRTRAHPQPRRLLAGPPRPSHGPGRPHGRDGAGRRRARRLDPAPSARSGARDPRRHGARRGHRRRDHRGRHHDRGRRPVEPGAARPRRRPSADRRRAGMDRAPRARPRSARPT